MPRTLADRAPTARAGGRTTPGLRPRGVTRKRDATLEVSNHRSVRIPPDQQIRVADDSRQEALPGPAVFFASLRLAALIRAFCTSSGSFFLITTALPPPSQPTPLLIVILTSLILGHRAGLRVRVPVETQRFARRLGGGHGHGPPPSLRHSPAQIEPGRRVADGIGLGSAVRTAGGRHQRLTLDSLAQRHLLFPQHRPGRRIQSQEAPVGGHREDPIAESIPARIHEGRAGSQCMECPARITRSEPVELERVVTGFLETNETGLVRTGNRAAAAGDSERLTPVPSSFMRPTSRRSPSART